MANLKTAVQRLSGKNQPVDPALMLQQYEALLSEFQLLSDQHKAVVKQNQDMQQGLLQVKQILEKKQQEIQALEQEKSQWQNQQHPPQQQESWDTIIGNANITAEKIVSEAQAQAEKMIEVMKKQIAFVKQWAESTIEAVKKKAAQAEAQKKQMVELMQIMYVQNLQNAQKYRLLMLQSASELDGIAEKQKQHIDKLMDCSAGQKDDEEITLPVLEKPQSDEN